MPSLSFGEWFFLALGVGGFVRLGWCLVYLIGDEALMPAWLDMALDTVAGLVLAAIAWARQTATTAALLLLLTTAPKGALR